MKTWLILLAAGVCSAIPLNQGGAEYQDDYPMEVPGLFEGDIDLEPGQDPTHRNAVGDLSRIWPGGVIPYVIQSSYSSAVKKSIHDALQELTEKTKVHGRTCIHFKPRAHETGYLYFTSGTGCHTSIGYNNKQRNVTLGPACMTSGTIMHETLHAMGFWHEQSSIDRDNFVTIHFDNIPTKGHWQFKKYEIPTMSELGQPYDYGSLMHYSRYSFGIDRSKPTITPKQPDVNIGHKNKLSAIDIKKVQILYGCIPGVEKTSGSGGFVTSPPNTTVTAPPAGSDVCTFQGGLCHWKTVAGTQMHWTRHRGSIQNSYAGPINDPTLDHSAYYLYIGDGHPHHTNRTAKLHSKTYPSGDYCVDFYYHMFDPSVTLNLNYITSDHQVHHVRGMHGHDMHDWHHVHAHPNVHIRQNFKFEFEGVIGSGARGVIGLDDIIIHPGRC